MNSIDSKQFIKSNLKQTDIVSVLQHWNSMKTKADLRKKYLSQLDVIVIDDSDSDTSTNSKICPPRKKLSDVSSDEDDKSEVIAAIRQQTDVNENSRRKKPLFFNFSDDDMESDSPLTCHEGRSHDTPECHHLAKVKQPLPYSFSDDEDTGNHKQHNAKKELATPLTTTKKIQSMILNRPQSVLMRPVACSTPLSTSNLSQDSVHHVGLEDFISQIASEASVCSSDSDTVIVEYDEPTREKTITLLQHTILQVAQDRSGVSNCLNNARIESLAVKRPAEEDKKGKKLKTKETDKNTEKGKSVCEKAWTPGQWLTKLKRPTPKSINGHENLRDNNKPSSSATQKDESPKNHDKSNKNGKEETSSQKKNVNKNDMQLEAESDKRRAQKDPKTHHHKETAVINRHGSSKEAVIKSRIQECTKSKDKVSSAKRKLENEDDKGKSLNKNNKSRNKYKKTSENTEFPKNEEKNREDPSKKETGKTDSDRKINQKQNGNMQKSLEKNNVSGKEQEENPKNSDRSSLKNKGPSKSNSEDVASSTSNSSVSDVSSRRNSSENDDSVQKSQNKNNGYRKDAAKDKSINKDKSVSSSGTKSPTKTSGYKNEDKKMNMNSLNLIKKLFEEEVFQSRHINNLLLQERKVIKTFLDMNSKYQYVCLKLILYQRKWYNIFKFCKRIWLEMEEPDISDMYMVLHHRGFIDIDYTNETMEELLNRLENTDLKSICNQFKLNRTLSKKEEMVKILLKHSNQQCTLTIKKTTKDLLLDKVQRKLGSCMRLSEDFQSAFYSTFSLATFVNPMFVNVQDYLKLMLKNNVIFPEYPIDDYVIFNSRKEFNDYVEARKYRDKIEDLKDHVLFLQIAHTAFSRLKALEQENYEQKFEEAPHLIRFTARSVYVSLLTIAVEKLYCKFPQDVCTWLNYMIRKVNMPHRLGKWYFYLVWIHVRYLPSDEHNSAVNLLFEVLHKKKDHVSEVQLYHLRKRGEQLLKAKKYKISQMDHDCLIKLMPKRIKTERFPERIIDNKTIRGNETGQKRNYVIQDEMGNKTIMNVEEIARRYYINELGYTDGEHCENSIVRATFTLFFFDVIYKPKRSIPGTFVSKIQSEPLDMNSRNFYSNRKEEIDQRLQEIESEWSDEHLLNFLKRQYDEHSHEFTLCEIEVVIKDSKLLEILVQCIGRKVLASIYKRLVENYRENRSGLPDLLVWNVERKECKFVEVKGEGDTLSIGQTLWLKYLQESGADIEVCHVHSIGSKRKIKKVDAKDVSLPSTSTAQVK